MGDWVLYFNFTATTSALMVALMGLLLSATASYIEQWERTYFRATFMMLFIYAASDLVAQVSLDFLGPEYTGLSQAGVFCELLFSAMIIPLIMAYLLHCTGEDRQTNTLFRCLMVFFALYVALLFAAQFTDAVYTISPDNNSLIPGPLYPALFVPPVALMIVSSIALARRMDALTPRKRIAFSVYVFVPFLSVFIQSLLFDLRIVVVGTNLSALAMFVYVLQDQMDAHVRHCEEAAQRRAQVIALQMRPHFIYNVLTSIYYLCAQNPKRAQQVTLDFTDYLRANFDAIAQQGEVPFAKELEHARAYLSVEQARLEQGLVVDIDCPHTAFRLPPLTLQPLAENAVKHGSDPELPPLHVRIATYAEPGCSVITVEDTGLGYGDPLPQYDGDNMPSTHHGPNASPSNHASALDNIRERLSACGGTLQFGPRRGGGTIAIVRIPTEWHSSLAE